jgi:phosphoribosylamine--glycine ligase
VLAAQGYPLAPRKGDAIEGLPPEREDAMVFHAATESRDGSIRTTGGRVLCVTVLAENVRVARQLAYELIKDIHFDGMQYRNDIGHRAVRH